MDKNLFYRSFELDRSLVDEKTRTVPVSFSSETPVPRWFGNEYLLHGKGNVDLARLKRMGSVLLNHNANVIVGPISKIRIEDKKGVAVVGFDDDEDGNKALGKVKSGSLRGVSVGYQVQKFRDVMEDEEYELDDGRKIKGPAMVATRWMPYEVSLTPIPADPSVGVGRELTRSLEGIEIERGRLQTGPDNKRDTPDSIRTFDDLLGRASAISPEAREIVFTMAVEGAFKREIEEYILNAGPEPDTGNIVPRNSDGVPGSRGGKPSFKIIKDSDFFDSISNPSRIVF